ncbi:tetraspanin-6-like isoform X2 [Periplaneta americana]
MKIYKHEVIRHLHVFVCLVLVVLRAGLLYAALNIRHSLLPLDAFLHDYVSVLLTYLLPSCALFVALGVFGASAGVAAKRWMFHTYNVILVILYFVEVILFILAFNMWMDFNNRVEHAMDDHMSNYPTNRRDIDYLQITFNCCGKYGAEEWFDAIQYIPVSCCPTRPEPSPNDFCALLEDFFYIVHNKGCLKQLQELPHSGVTLITSLLIILCVVEMISFCLAYLSKSAVKITPTQYTVIPARKNNNLKKENIHLI